MDISHVNIDKLNCELEQQITEAFNRYDKGLAEFISDQEMTTYMEQLKLLAVQGKL